MWCFASESIHPALARAVSDAATTSDVVLDQGGRGQYGLGNSVYAYSSHVYRTEAAILRTSAVYGVQSCQQHLLGSCQSWAPVLCQLCSPCLCSQRDRNPFSISSVSAFTFDSAGQCGALRFREVHLASHVHSRLCGDVAWRRHGERSHGIHPWCCSGRVNLTFVSLHSSWHLVYSAENVQATVFHCLSGFICR